MDIGIDLANTLPDTPGPIFVECAQREPIHIKADAASEPSPAPAEANAAAAGRERRQRRLHEGLLAMPADLADLDCGELTARSTSRVATRTGSPRTDTGSAAMPKASVLDCRHWRCPAPRKPDATATIPSPAMTSCT
jgi:hypothetical protein